MIVKLTEKDATTEGTRGFFHFYENEFNICYYRKEKVRFFRTKHIPFKSLYFFDMFRLTTWEHWDTLIWHKEQ